MIDHFNGHRPGAENPTQSVELTGLDHIPTFGKDIDESDPFFDRSDTSVRWCQLPPDIAAPIIKEYPWEFLDRALQVRTVPTSNVEADYNHFYQINNDGRLGNLLTVPDRESLRYEVLSREDRLLNILLKSTNIFTELKEKMNPATIVIGGGGTVGLALTNYLLRYSPGTLRVYENDHGDAHTLKNPNVDLRIAGIPKLEYLADQVFWKSPYTKCDFHQEWVTSENIDRVITPDTSIYICANDDIGAKIAAWKRCRELKVPYMLATDVGTEASVSVQVFDGTENDNLYLGRVPIGMLEGVNADIMTLKETGVPALVAQGEAMRKMAVIHIVGATNVTTEMLQDVAGQMARRDNGTFQQPAISARLNEVVGGHIALMAILGRPIPALANLDLMDALLNSEEKRARMETKLALLTAMLQKKPTN